MFAQRKAQETVLTANAGFSLYRIFVLASIIATENDTTFNFISKTNPVVSFSLDHFMTKNFSFGGSIAYQKVTVNYDRLFGDSLTEFENIDASAAKLSFTLRGLFYYGKSEKKQFYSGVKLGYVSVVTNDNSTDLEYTVITNLARKRATIGIIPFGMRYFFTENIGCNLELSLGVPNFISFGLNYKIPSKKSS
jgi:hypothetical protein